MEILIGLIIAVVVIAGVVIVLARRSPSTEEASAVPTVDGEGVPSRSAPLRGRLVRTSSLLGRAVGSMFTATDGVRWEDLEDALILADVGPTTASAIVERVKGRSPESADMAADYLSAELRACFGDAMRDLVLEGSPAVVVVVGVNGAGKTTTIGKIAGDLTGRGSTVLLGAADTFRAAADSQLIAWGDRVGIDVVSGNKGQDPASVAFAAIDRARTDGIDVVIIDTAGRLHAHTNLMQELAKIVRVAEREAGSGAEVLLVLDGSTGQNGIAQARAFTDAVGVTGVIVTKLDGTAKGGVAIAVEQELGLPIKYIGIGEGVEDLIPFSPDDFVEALTTR